MPDPLPACPPPLTETDRIINRHMARLLDNLEQVSCPQIYLDAVKSALSWLRKDLKAHEELREAGI